LLFPGCTVLILLVYNILNDICEHPSFVFLRTGHFEHDLDLDQVNCVEFVDFFACAARELLFDGFDEGELFVLLYEYGQFEAGFAKLKSLLFKH